MAKSDDDLARLATMTDEQLVADVKASFVRFKSCRYSDDADAEYRYLLLLRTFLGNAGKDGLYELGKQQWMAERHRQREADARAMEEMKRRPTDDS